jgi:hypothetical protein
MKADGHDDQSPPEEAKHRFETLTRAVLRAPPLQLKDIPRKQPYAKRKRGKPATSSPSEPS